MKRQIEFETGTGNVFADIGSTDPDEKLLRAQLLAAAARAIKKRRLTQSEIGRLTGLKQPEVSKLVNGVFQAFSADRLARVLARLGYDVKVTVKLKPLVDFNRNAA